MATPRLSLLSEEIRYRERKAGRYAIDVVASERVAVLFKPRFRKFDAYPITCELFHQLEDRVEAIYIVDKDTDDVLRYSLDAYRDGEVLHWNAQDQYAPSVDEAEGIWKGASKTIIL